MGRLRGDNDWGSRGQNHPGVWWHTKKKKREREKQRNSQTLVLTRRDKEAGEQERETQAKANHGGTENRWLRTWEYLPWRRKDLYHSYSPSTGKEQVGTLNPREGEWGTTCFGMKEQAEGLAGMP